jgi:hypothetical protein
MFRAGVVDHPKMWPFCGYNEIQDPPGRYRTIDLDILTRLMGFRDMINSKQPNDEVYRFVRNKYMP